MPWSKKKPKPKSFLLTFGKNESVARAAIFDSLEKLSEKYDESLQQIIWQALYEYTEKEELCSED